ncbi:MULTISPECIES: PilZ domain-containing protein [Marinobacter]|jgi:hypothetical protein|uniref:PilZ domain-containing protein n=1 Tax=Marinobacter TaxID=2742 RepID=UPI001C97718B|nr:PilZ domain-containing protein [Marinobacter nauticus]MBY5937694.1 PilZ domain-containing protein [Marinobacter nauticus]MBY5954922.1 PilZ domain-containing protein [Marinobacter nauticus]MBY6008715.1 PilZ domain-containing protein [Marinobacter nauticus]MBY6192840.1 PilZ domain-containing protein [Marinobacter nauticus]MBY6213988.1 PilZ domain-containing protein [Marinobacter nauticus]
MEKRQHFRLSDFLALEAFDGNKKIFPATPLSDDTKIQALHGDVLKAVMRGLRKAKTQGKVSTHELLALLSHELELAYSSIATFSGSEHDDPRRCAVSLSEGGIRIDACGESVARFQNRRLKLSLYLRDGIDEPLVVSANLRGQTFVEAESKWIFRFEFTGMTEKLRQRLFRYILQEQTKKVRTSGAEQAAM